MREKDGSRKRNIKSKSLAPANYLIVCEGKETEPNYFNGLRKKINEKYGNKIDVMIPKIDIKGTGKNTIDLVNYTQKSVNHSSKKYGQVWVVFDKDDYKDAQFDSAIKLCEYNVAWSNPNFELWLLSHFRVVNKYVSKDNIFDELDKEFKRNKLGSYNKNDDKIFEKVTKEGNVYNAIENCRKMEVLNKKYAPSKRNPMTTVYKIVEDLREYI